jgi:2-methylcitrate dehydratase PrpD
MTTVAVDPQVTEITRTLTEYLVGITFDDIPKEVVESAKLYSLECIGHMLRAREQRVSQLVVEYLRATAASPLAIVVGTGMRSSPSEAAYANGTFAHADELESHGTIPGTGLVPAIAAGVTVADWVAGTSGQDYLAAVVAGVEMQGRLGSAAIGACDRGFMGISLVGTGGAAATAGRLMGLNVAQMQNCFGIALPLSNGSLRGCGYMTHVHEAGIPTRTGVFAAQMAAGGFTGCPDYLDGAYSWGEQFAGGAARKYDPGALTAGLGQSLFLERCDVAPKQYGSCGITHQAIEGTAALMLEHGLEPADIDRVELLVPPFADRVAPFRAPENGEQAKFSIRQGVAAILADGIPQLPLIRPFSDATFSDRRYVAALQRVDLKVQEGLPSQRGFTEQTVTLVLHDGRRLSKVVDSKRVHGHVSNPFTVAERVDMVRHTMEPVTGLARAERLIEVVMDLEHREFAEVAALIAD